MQARTSSVSRGSPERIGPDGDARATSVFVNGHFPRRRGLIILLGVLGGFLLTVIWSAEFVDQTIGDTIANTALGHDAKETPIQGIAAGILFAFVSGVAGTFTACNIAAFGAVAPIMGSTGSRILFLALSYFAGGRLHRWISARPSRLAIIVAVALIVAGVFTFLYWDVRELARREIIPWYPTAPWS